MTLDQILDLLVKALERCRQQSGRNCGAEWFEIEMIKTCAVCREETETPITNIVTWKSQRPKSAAGVKIK